MNTSSDPQLMLELGKNYVVERIENCRVRKGQLEQFVKWQDFDNSDLSWEKAEVLNFQELIEEYETQLRSRQGNKQKRTYFESVATVAVIWI